MPVINPKKIVIFVHGIRSSAEAWQPLIELLKKDDAVTARFEFDCFAYNTKAVELRPDQCIARIDVAAVGLREFIDSPKFYDREITLVGHSQGGLVIQAFLYNMLTNGRGEKLSAIRQVIMMANREQGCD
jgi:triacylglycerol esterase/lipase EstA (alpha/beta hydrolase family)